MRTHYVLIAAGMLGVLSLANAYAYSDLSTHDFVRNASIANDFEIKSSRLALEKSQNAEVKEFAQQMIDDHTKTGEQFKEVLKSALTQEKPAEKLGAKYQLLLERLEKSPNNEFDTAYINIQTDAHHEAVDLFADFVKYGQDPAIQAFAAQTLPTLKGHLNHIQKMKDARQ